VGITTVTAKKLIINNCDSVCSYYCLTYPVYKAHAPNYIGICELTPKLLSIFSHIHAKSLVNILKIKEFFFLSIQLDLKYFSF